MKTVKVTEKYDGEGRLIERTTETTETIETAPLVPWYPLPYPTYPQPIITFESKDRTPQITWTVNTCTGGIH